MMKHVNLFVRIGRAPKQCLGSFDYSNPKGAELACDGLQAQKSSELSTSGVAPERVLFERAYVDSGVVYSTSEFGLAVVVKKGKK